MASERSPLLDVKPALNMSSEPPAQSFATARTAQPPGSADDDKGDVVQLPQAIAHRGYKAKFPENTLAAFSAAVGVGAHAIETDLHLSKDKVVVLSHDPTLKRCFGEAKTIADCDWAYLSGLETVAKPTQHMPRLIDLLDYLTQPGKEHVWLLLDIKRDDDPDELLGAVAAAIASVKPRPPNNRPWSERIVLGPWTDKTIDACRRHLPGYAIVLITWSVAEASRLLRETDDVGFNMFQFLLTLRDGREFMRQTQKAGRHLFVWTVNKEKWMHWSIRERVDGVVTDEPAKFLAVCDEWRAGGGVRTAPLSMVLGAAWLRFLLAAFSPLLRVLVRYRERKARTALKT